MAAAKKASKSARKSRARVAKTATKTATSDVTTPSGAVVEKGTAVAPATKSARRPAPGEEVRTRTGRRRFGIVSHERPVEDLKGVGFWTPVLADNGKDGVQYFPVVAGKDAWEIVENIDAAEMTATEDSGYVLAVGADGECVRRYSDGRPDEPCTAAERRTLENGS